MPLTHLNHWLLEVFAHLAQDQAPERREQLDVKAGSKLCPLRKLLPTKFSCLQQSYPQPHQRSAANQNLGKPEKN